MTQTFHVSTVAEAKAVIQQLQEYIKQQRATSADLEDVKILDLTVLTSNKLQAAGIKTVGQLAQLSADDLWETAKIGKKSSNEIDAKLAEYRQRE